MPADRTRAQMWAESSLAPHDHRLELRGSPRDLSWPRICAHCGEVATERIVVKKAFRPLPSASGRGGNGLRAYRIGSAAIPFCANCAATHRATVNGPSTMNKLIRLVLNPLVIPVAGSAWLTRMALRDWRTNPIADPDAFPEWAVVAGLVAATAWCLFLLWHTTAPSRLEPQTEITRACDFSGNVSAFFDRERHIYRMRNKAFADAMAAENRDRVWTAENQARSTTRNLVVAVLTLASLGALVGLLRLMGF